MEKYVDFNETIFNSCNRDSEILNILEFLGFTDIAKPGMISTVGRFMTINKGSKVKNIDIDKIKEEFIRRGYEIKN